MKTNQIYSKYSQKRLEWVSDNEGSTVGVGVG